MGSPLPFDLDKAIAGAPVVTRNGRPVSGLCDMREHGATATRCLVGVLEGRVHVWTEDGNCLQYIKTREDLFLADVSKSEVANG